MKVHAKSEPAPTPIPQKRRVKGVLIGVISDTHGLVRPALKPLLAGVDCLIHAGDIGKPEVVDQLSALAPLHIIRGNVDRGVWAESIAEHRVFTLGERRILLVHDLKASPLKPVEHQIDVVISGHSHRPSALMHNGILYLNPGSVGPRRFRLPISLALLHLSKDRADPILIEIPP
jgi:hypothetical protein